MEAENDSFALEKPGDVETVNIKRSLERLPISIKKKSIPELEKLLSIPQAANHKFNYDFDIGDAYSSTGITPLILAAAYGSIPVIELLLNHQAYKFHKTDNGSTVLHLAARFGRLKNLNFFLASGARMLINARMTNDASALHEAARWGHDQICKALLQKSAKIELQDKDGLTALMQAAIWGHEKVVKVLLENGAKLDQQSHNNFTALHHATYNNHAIIVRHIIERGPDINRQEGDWGTALHIAAGQGQVAIAKLLLSCADIEINAMNSFGNTPLFLATDRAHPEMVQLLLDCGANMSNRNDKSHTPLHHASINGFVDLVERFLDKGVDLEATNSFGNTPLQLASINGHSDVLCKLLDHHANINTANGISNTPLHDALMEKKVHIAQILLDRGAETNYLNMNGAAPFLLACENGCLEMAQTLHSRGSPIEQSNKFGNTPLQLACATGHVEVVKWLLSEGAEIESKNESGNTPLQLASGKGHSDVVHILLSGRAQVDSTNKERNTPLQLACAGGHKDVVQLLLSHEADIESTNDTGNTPLQLAATNGRTDIAGLLLSRGANVDSTSLSGNTSLQLAASNGHLETVQFLLSNNADVDLANKNGNTPLQLASARGYCEVIQSLLEAGAALEKANNDGDTSLHLACDKRQFEAVKLLLEKGADVHALNKKGSSALHLASVIGHTKIAQLLIHKGANSNAANISGNTPLHLATSEHDFDMVKLLIHHADINKTNKSGNTPLHDACCAPHVEIVQLLLRNGANPSKLDGNGWSALHFACSTGHINVVKTLLVSKIDPTIRDADGRTALSRAAMKTRRQIMLHMLRSNWYYPEDPVRSKGCITKDQEKPVIAEKLLEMMNSTTGSIRKSPEEVNALMYWAVINNVPGLMQICMEYIPDATSPFRGKMTWLHVVAQYGHADLVDIFHGVGFYTVAEHGMTALHFAAANGHLEVVDILLRKIPEAPICGCRKRIEAIIQNNDDGESALTLAAKGGHQRVLKLLWSEVKEFAKANPDHMCQNLEHARNLIELAARFETPGQEITLRYLLETWVAKPLQIHVPPAAPILHLAVYCTQPVVVWWLLSNGGHLNSQEIKTARRIVDKGGADGVSQKAETYVRDLLHNPPPIIEHMAVVENDSVPMVPDLSSTKKAALELPVVVTDFYLKEGTVSLQQIPADIHNLIYEKGPQEIMYQAQGLDCRQLKLLKRELIISQSTESETEKGLEGSNIPSPPIQLEKAHEGSASYRESQTETFNKKRREDQPVGNFGNHYLRWLHIPVNNMQFSSDLLTRLSIDSGRTQRLHRTLLGFFKRSWTQVAAGNGEHYMKPQCLEESMTNMHHSRASEQDQTAVSNITESNKIARDKKSRVALYIPYLTLREVKVKKTGDGIEKHQPCDKSRDIQHAPQITGRPGEETLGQEPMTTKEIKPKEVWHQPLTLDQYYYATIKDTSTRDNDQVLSRYLQGISKDKNRNAQHSNETTWIFAVDQLWLWIVDEDTIITSTTRPSKEMDDILISRIRELLTFGETNGLFVRPRSANSLLELILGITAGLFMEKRIVTVDEGREERKGPLEIFRESIRKVAEAESNLFQQFLKSLDDERSQRDEYPGPRLIRRTPQNPYHIISHEARLLDEIKDIRDELNMLCTLAEAQDRVWKQAFKTDNLDTYSFENNLTCTPNQVVREIHEMIKEAESVQDAINTLLELRQKQAGIKEAEFGREQANDTARQANTVLVFTLVTIIFLPLSFLSSLFALNVSDFPHDKDDVSYKGWWIFPILFGTSAAVSIPCIWFALNVDRTMDFWHGIRPHKSIKHHDDQSKTPSAADLKPGIASATYSSHSLPDEEGGTHRPHRGGLSAKMSWLR